MATASEITIEVEPAPGLPSKATLVFIGFSDDQLEGNHPKKGTIPAFYWKSGKVKIGEPLALKVPLPASLNMLVVADVDGDGKPNETERSTGLMIKFDASETKTIRLDRFFGDLGGPRRDGVERELVIDASRILDQVDAKSARVLVLAYPEDGLRGGMPRAGSVPDFLWVSPEMKLAAGMTLIASVPDLEEGDALVLLDIDGDGLPSPEEPISPAFEDFRAPPEGVGWEVVLDRLFQPTRKGSVGSQAPGDGGGEGAVVPVLLDAEPRIKIQSGLRLLVVGYDDDDVFKGKPMSDAEPTFFWSRPEPDLEWPYSGELRMPTSGRYLVVVDLDENNKASLGDLATAATRADPKGPRPLSLVLNRTLTFSDGDDEEEREQP